MIRLIATDMDDTLLDAGSRVTERTARALRMAMDAGVLISLSSGRMTESMLTFAQSLQVNAPMILFNGAMIFDHRTERTLFANAIPAALAKQVAQAVDDRGIYLQAYPGKGYFCNRRTDHTDRYEKSIRVPVTELGVPISQWLETDMVKLLAISTPEVIARVQDDLQRQFPTGVRFMKSKPCYLEIVAQGIDKGGSLARLAGFLGIDREEVMAFGDGQNDASMVAYAGCGVAMDNAVAECKAGAKIIAPKNTEDGVAQIIEQFLKDGKLGRS